MSASDPSWSVHQMDVAVGNALGQAKLDLQIELDERPEGHVIGRLIYDTDLFEAVTARRMVSNWHTLLHGIAAQSQHPISDLPILSEHELQQQLVEWNATTAEYPRDSCIHALVAQQVRANPAAIAIEC